MTTRSRQWLICLLAIATTQAAAADRGWRMATTPHYRLISQVSDRETTAWMRGFDQFILSTSDMLKIDLRLLTPLTVVIFDRDKDYAPYKPARPNGRTANVAGQFVARSTWSMIAMEYGAMTEESRRVISHEATHWLTNVDQTRQPAWFREGIAEMFSTFERRGDQVSWGKPVASHIMMLSAGGRIPLAQFLTEPSARFDRDDRTAQFYAQAWAFTHFMLFSNDPGRRELFSKFLSTYKTKSGEATVEAVFGPTLPDVEKAFNLYVGQRSWNYTAQPAKPAPEPPAPQPAPAGLVEASLGFLAMGAGRNELAQRHAEKAIELDPKSPDGYAVRAYLAMDDGAFDRAVTQAEEALLRGSKDSALFVLLGDSYSEGPGSGRPEAKRARADMYEKAINLNPRQLTPYVRLTEALFDVEKPRDEDAGFLNHGLRLFPGADWLRVGTAVVDYRLGRREVALTTLDTVLQPESTLEQRQRTYAAALRRNWLADAMRSEVEAALGKNDFTGARATVVSYRERIGEDADMASFLEQVDSGLVLRELMSRYDAAMNANKKAEARALAEQLLARPDLTAELRSYLQQHIAGGR